MKSKEHIIIGFGRWGQTVNRNLLKFKNFKKIHILKKNKEHLFDLSKILKKNHKIKTAHICFQNDNKFKFVKYLIKKKINILLEKPPFKHVNEMTKTYNLLSKKKNIVFINYSELAKEGLLQLIKYEKKISQKPSNISFNLGSIKNYKNFSEFLSDWIDHPLCVLNEIIKLKNIKIKKIKKNRRKKNKKINIQIEISSINIFINLFNYKKIHNININYLDKKIIYDDILKKTFLYNKKKIKISNHQNDVIQTTYKKFKNNIKLKKNFDLNSSIQFLNFYNFLKKKLKLKE